MLDLIPFARARRQMTYIDRQTDCVRQTLQPQFPQARTAAIASSGISANQQFPCFRIRLRAHMLPPRQNAIDGKVCGIVINPDAHPTAVACHIIHAIRNNLAQFFILKIMDICFLWRALRLPLAAVILEVANKFLFLPRSQNLWVFS